MVGGVDVFGVGGEFFEVAAEEAFGGATVGWAGVKPQDGVVGADHGDTKADDEAACDEEVEDAQAEGVADAFGHAEGVPADADDEGVEDEGADDAREVADVGVPDDDFVEAEDAEDDGADDGGAQGEGEQVGQAGGAAFDVVKEEAGAGGGDDGAEEVKAEDDSAVDVLQAL